MIYLLLIPAILSFWLLAAHYLRDVLGPAGFSPLPLFLFVMCVMAPFVFLWRRREVLRAAQFLLLVGAFVWIGTTWDLLQARLAAGRPFQAMVIILSSVAVWTLLSALLLQKLRPRFPRTNTHPPANAPDASGSRSG